MPVIPAEYMQDDPQPQSGALFSDVVVIPSHLASRLFHCYYGAGPRQYETSSTAELVPADELRTLRQIAVEYSKLRASTVASSSPAPTPTPTSTPPTMPAVKYPPGFVPRGVEATNPMGT